jgi:uncharacterized protein GlcG (DUF336 family)
MHGSPDLQVSHCDRPSIALNFRRPSSSEHRMSAFRGYKLRHLAATSLALLILAAPAHAQLRTTRSVALDGAQRALAAAAAEARQNDWTVSIAVVDPGGELVGFVRLDGAPFSSPDVAIGKARTAARFRRPSRVFDSTLTAGRYALLGLPGAVPVEGGVPIVVNGEVVGAVGVSGVTSAQDAQVARAGVAAVQP